MNSRDTYVAKMRLQLDELNSKLSEMEDKAKLARVEARDTYRAEIDKLHASSKEAMSRLDALGRAGETTWETMVAEMEKARNALRNSFKDFKARL